MSEVPEIGEERKRAIEIGNHSYEIENIIAQLKDYGPVSREVSLGITNLEQGVMWLEKYYEGLL